MIPSKIAFICYESPFAPCGGVAAVMKYLPAEIGRFSQKPVYVLTPYHPRIMNNSEPGRRSVSLGTVSVPYKKEKINIDVLLLDRDVNWIFLKPRNQPFGEPPFFYGSKHPYDVGEYRREAPQVLLRDSLIFGVAAVQALSLIDDNDLSTGWDLMIQDWEAATTCLALTGNQTAKVINAYITIHNSYDSRASEEDLGYFGIDPELCPGNTVLDRALPLAQHPVFTVSEQFALDLTGEIMQARILAPHLSKLLSSRVVGVNNGTFTEPSIPETFLDNIKRGDPTPMVEFKTQRRIAALQALETLSDSEETPLWGDLNQFIRDEAPWFIMAGRDDCRQKGFDLFASAADQYLSAGKEGRFILFPIPGDKGLDGIFYLQRLAHKHPQSVIVLPFIFRAGYLATIQGASFGVMPSFYEPFGMANEFYLNGAVGIGRATGGILHQIIPYRSALSFTDSVRIRSDRWFSDASLPTGFLFREMDGIPNAVGNWQEINSATSTSKGGSPDWSEQRKKLPLFQSMVAELSLCLTDAVELYVNQQDLYYEMLADGYYHIRENFSWEKAARKYLEYLDR